MYPLFCSHPSTPYGSRDMSTLPLICTTIYYQEENHQLFWTLSLMDTIAQTERNSYSFLECNQKISMITACSYLPPYFSPQKEINKTSTIPKELKLDINLPGALENHDLGTQSTAELMILGPPKALYTSYCPPACLEVTTLIATELNL